MFSLSTSVGPFEAGSSAALVMLREYFLKLLTTTVDDITLSLRSIIVWLALAAIGFVAIAGVIVIASWLLLSGMAEGLGGLFGRAWAGRL